MVARGHFLSKARVTCLGNTIFALAYRDLGEPEETQRPWEQAKSSWQRATQDPMVAPLWQTRVAMEHSLVGGSGKTVGRPVNWV